MFTVGQWTSGLFLVRIRKNYIRILAGDRVTVEIGPYDLTRGFSPPALIISLEDKKWHRSNQFANTIYRRNEVVLCQICPANPKQTTSEIR